MCMIFFLDLIPDNLTCSWEVDLVEWRRSFVLVSGLGCLIRFDSKEEKKNFRFSPWRGVFLCLNAYIWSPFFFDDLNYFDSCLIIKNIIMISSRRRKLQK